MMHSKRGAVRRCGGSDPHGLGVPMLLSHCGADSPPLSPLTNGAYSHTVTHMRARTSFYLDAELQAGLKELKERDGTPEAESIRRAIAAYLAAKGIKITPVNAQKGPKR